MQLLKGLLPAPSAITDEYSQVRRDPWFRGREDALPTSTAVVVKEPPPYGRRQGFRPRSAEDFGDGGAFPEIHVAQFPLGMGLGERKGKSEGQIALQYDADGKLRHDAIARLGHDKNKVVYTKLADMRAKAWDEDDEDIQRPDEETIAEQTEKTRLALEKITESKVHNKESFGWWKNRRIPWSLRNSGSQQRIIRMVEEQKDPMEPPKFRWDMFYVLVTTKDQNDWKIPPCISNWKNPKGFTVSLDKRLAADGRGLQQTHINEGFAKLSEALYIADRKARESVEARAQLEKRVAQHKKLEQEARMREMAAKARQERAGIRKRDEDEDEAVKAREETHINEGFAKLSEALYIADRKARESVEARAQLEKRVAQHKKLEQEARMREMAAKARQVIDSSLLSKDLSSCFFSILMPIPSGTCWYQERDEDEDEAVKAREEVRRDRLDDIRKERNIARNRPDKVDKLMRDRDRDISEKIVLGLPDAKVRSSETQFDQRLFDQNKGLDSGAMDDETYNPYDKAWRGGDNVQQHIYRPSKNIDKDVYGDDLDKIINTQRFVPDKGFSGAEGSSRGSGPVQFEREQDVFGLGDLFQQVKNKRGGDRDNDRDDSKRTRH
ncbi:SKIP/SNW domain protein [Teladorsagia circumcincta]|uniref:SKIP/SNW domain protein n=1 Tax=Teladorsagia circumcincta TaxID=45464 RepID=A0A2G9V4R5_TELCI|nr:SKIP/SNW domain protein [Teladorsagia circumcincta]